MNKVMLMGRLVRDPEVRYSQGENANAYATFTLAVDRRFRRNDGGDQQSQQQPTADFLRCVTFGKQAEFVEKYLRQGIKMLVIGRIQTGSYTNREGQKVYTTDIVVEELEFAESKAASDNYRSQHPASAPASYGQKPQAQAPADGAQDSADSLDGFMNIPDTIEEGLPFS